MNCECLSKCIFFNNKMKNMPAAVEKYKNQFCLGNNSECARYLVFKKAGRDKVPSDLFPNQRTKAKIIIEQNQ